jgi:hypothetical protein
MTDNDRWSTEDLAFARLGVIGRPSLAEQLEQRRIQQGIARTMRDVIGRDAKFNPNQTVPPEAAGPRGSGWVEPKPLALPPGQEVIERLCNHFLPSNQKPKREG